MKENEEKRLFYSLLFVSILKTNIHNAILKFFQKFFLLPLCVFQILNFFGGKKAAIFTTVGFLFLQMLFIYSS